MSTKKGKKGCKCVHVRRSFVFEMERRIVKTHLKYDAKREKAKEENQIYGHGCCASLPNFSKMGFGTPLVIKSYNTKNYKPCSFVLSP